MKTNNTHLRRTLGTIASAAVGSPPPAARTSTRAASTRTGRLSPSRRLPGQCQAVCDHFNSIGCISAARSLPTPTRERDAGGPRRRDCITSCMAAVDPVGSGLRPPGEPGAPALLRWRRRRAPDVGSGAARSGGDDGRPLWTRDMFCSNADGGNADRHF